MESASHPNPSAPDSGAVRPRLTPLRAQPLKEQVLEQLRALLDGGALKPGDQLPSERELSEELEVSRGTVREAVQFLGALGLVEIRHGQGTFVRATLANPEVHDEWRAWTLRNSGRIRDLLEVRRGLESFAAELAAQRRAEAELRSLEEALDGMATAIRSGDVTALVQSDVNFHHGLCAAAGNPALVELADVLGQRLLRERAAAWDVPGRPERSLEEHTAIFKAVTSGDATAARAALIAHLDSVERDLALIAQPG
jgi:GntR family transcriptional regulator, transcriptional repressor for pyruvate dehydrogenase complex